MKQLLLLLFIFSIILSLHAIHQPMTVNWEFVGTSPTTVIQQAKTITKQGDIIFAGAFKTNFTLNAEETLYQLQGVWNLFVVKLNGTTGAIKWFFTRSCSAQCDFYGDIVTSSNDDDNGFILLHINSGYPINDILSTPGGPAYFTLSASKGELKWGSGYICHYGCYYPFRMYIDDSDVVYIVGKSYASVYGLTAYTQPTSGSSVMNFFIQKATVSKSTWSLDTQWIIQTTDTLATENNLRFMYEVAPLGKNLIISGTFPTSINWVDKGGRTTSLLNTWSTDSTAFYMMVNSSGYIEKASELGSYGFKGPIKTVYATSLDSSVVLCRNQNSTINSCLTLSNSTNEPATVISQVVTEGTLGDSSLSGVISVNGYLYLANSVKNTNNGCPNAFIVDVMDVNGNGGSWKYQRCSNSSDGSMFLAKGVLNSPLNIIYYYYKNLDKQTAVNNGITIVQVPSLSNITCGGISYMDSSVCNGHGQCIFPDVCLCDSGWKSKNCLHPSCFGISKEDISVCNGRGVCTSSDNCTCHTNYTGNQCQFQYCFGISSNSSKVCSGNGLCTFVNSCKCNAGFIGDMCETNLPECFGYLYTSNSTCSGNGKCVSSDQCICNAKFVGNQCQYPTCFGVPSYNGTVCSQRGKCIDPDACSCNLPYENDKYGDCTLFECFGIYNNDSDVCSGNGECYKPEKCKCEEGYIGKECEFSEYERIMIGLSVSLPLGFLLLILVLLGSIVFAYTRRLWSRRKQRENELDKKLLDFELGGETEEDEITRYSISTFNLSRDRTFFIPYSDLTFIKKIGEGGFGCVFKAKWKETIVAVKSIDIEDEDDESFEKESQLLSSLKHPNIITFFGISLSDTKKFMVVEFLQRGSLDKVIYDLKSGVQHLTLKEKLGYLLDVASGVCYLHNLKPNPIVHRDLKPGNILVDNNKSCKVCDFGLSRVVTNNKSSLTSNVGSMYYMPNEMLSDENLCKDTATAIDVYSFSIIIWELVFEDHPYLYTNVKKLFLEEMDYETSAYKKLTPYNIVVKVSQGLRPVIPFSTVEMCAKWCDKYLNVQNVDVMFAICTLAQECWNPNPELRPSFEEIVFKLSSLKECCVEK